ncbi:hypothetical protein PVK06_005524 [Gossypium arboreum]|uniref:Uncharacterized protein n=1 Tax=Gossypium arboreum TaxID=29729 RepID=A0ABR0QVW0_GOSAR|nr:hypothetical protein PVK06_005524 [Gossypium arboreum]
MVKMVHLTTMTTFKFLIGDSVPQAGKEKKRKYEKQLRKCWPKGFILLAVHTGMPQSRQIFPCQSLRIDRYVEHWTSFAVGISRRHLTGGSGL